MPTKALSLIGFVKDLTTAIHYLKLRCVPEPAKDDDALEADWRIAQARLGPPAPSAGNPQMRPISMAEPHIQALLATSWAPRIKSALDQGASFQMVEIDPLIAAQITVDLEKSNSQCAGLSHPPTYDQMMRLCLPFELASGAVQLSQQPQSIIIKSESLNLVIGAQGPMPFAAHVVGVNVGWVLPFVHVARLNGRCLLHNGYNRTVGARLAGATEVPCLFRDVPDAAAAGFDQSHTVEEALLMSDNPPTIGHFARGSAFEVQLRRTIRLIEVNWSQHQMYDE
jgi:hypothetical protein